MKMDLVLKSQRIHLVGIGGIGVSALAGVLHAQGKKLSGSDQEKNALTQHLEKLGVKIQIGTASTKLPPKTEVVIHSLAVPENHPALREARRQKIPVLSYPQAVGQLTRHFYTIAICGTHGKSTITALIAKALIENNFDPTVIVGTKLKELKNLNYRVGKSKILVLEACEYRRAFLNYSPRAIVLHTLDPDHLDYYKDFEDYLDAFREFTEKLPPDGYFFGNLDDDDVHEVIRTMQSKKFPSYNTFTYGAHYENADFSLREKQIYHRGIPVGELGLQIPGAHNRTNALSAFSVCSTLGTAPRNILKSLNDYQGAYRRFEQKGKFGKTILIDDYAHHPAEITATLQAAREMFPKKKICVVFQPHQYNRTKNLLKDFGTSFKQADEVIIPNIYEVRDSKSDVHAVSAQMLVDEIRKNKTPARLGHDLAGSIDYLRNHAKDFDVVITMGAGDVWKVSEALLAS